MKMPRWNSAVWTGILTAIMGLGVQAAELSGQARNGLLGWYDASDTASIVMQGDRVGTWKDKSGQGHDFSQPANGPTRIESEGAWSIGGATMLCKGVNKTLPALTVHAVVKVPPSYSAILAFRPDSPTEFVAAGWTIGSRPSLFSKSGSTNAFREVEDGQWHLLTFVRDELQRRFFVDGVPAGEATGKDAACEMTDLLLSAWNTHVSPQVRLGELLIYERAQDQAQVAEVSAYLQEKWKAALPDSNSDVVVFVGNSLSTGMYCGNGKTWTAFAAQKLGLKSWNNVSKGGITTPQLAALADANIDPIRKTSKGRGILVLWEGTNDIAVNKASGAKAAENIASFCAARKKDGWDKIIVLTILPRASGPEFEKARGELNDLLLKKAADYQIDAVVDLGADSAIAAAGAQDDKKYFVDQVHLSEAGNQRVAELVAKTMKDMKGQ
jgi:lysophospholipase L1-like esterase